MFNSMNSKQACSEMRLERQHCKHTKPDLREGSSTRVTARSIIANGNRRAVFSVLALARNGRMFWLQCSNSSASSTHARINISNMQRGRMNHHGAEWTNEFRVANRFPLFHARGAMTKWPSQYAALHNVKTSDLTIVSSANKTMQPFT